MAPALPRCAPTESVTPRHGSCAGDRARGGLIHEYLWRPASLADDSVTSPPLPSLRDVVCCFGGRPDSLSDFFRSLVRTQVRSVRDIRVQEVPYDWHRKTAIRNARAGSELRGDPSRFVRI